METKIDRIALTLLVAVMSAGAPGCGEEPRQGLRGDEAGWPSPEGSYLGMGLPGRQAELFAPGVLTRGHHEISMTFSPDLDEFFYITADRAYSFYVIVHGRTGGGVWERPVVAPFSGRYRDLSVSFKPDGSGLVFSSDRPSDNLFDIWEVAREADGWSEPLRLTASVPDFAGGSCPTQTSSGDIYYQSLDNDIYMVAMVAGGYSRPEILPAPVSTEAHEGRPFISADGSYLLFNSNRPGGFGESDIYVSFAGPEGWSEPLNLGAGVNSSSGDFAASVTPDGRFIFFSSYRAYGPEEFIGKEYGELVEMFSSPKNGYAALYWVQADIIQELAASAGIK